MDEIIDFLSNNMFIVAIAVGLVVSLFNKSRQKGAARMPDFSGRTGAPATEQQASEQQISNQQISNQQISNQQISNQYREHRPAMAAAPPPPVQQYGASTLRTGQLSSMHNASDMQPAREAEAFRMPEGDELRKAIIVAEILGPPRSKRPYRLK
ncbi:hypothetical protein PAECIP111893_03774 [Paenibacillus plantiphilus]|uniref:Uncharacterized protein n=1 Tax=Paenibacillus plantiphilus TaxID=2905650 RepID=A0ABN8GNX2_9BACL|nr:hypothetical protein [Paenibacillus plantiphilus]CAH1214112.1 hypothetical protein PAECIP111893_03774 [Paenibacillus plantiphilus]